MTSCSLHPINPTKRRSENTDRFPMGMELQPRPFDVKNAFAKTRRKRMRKLHGPDSPLYSTIWPMVYIVRIFGFVPYDFSRDRLVPANIYLIFSAIAVVLYSYIICEVFQRMIIIKRETPTLGRTENGKMVVNYSVGIYELGLAIFTRCSFVKVWNALQGYDESVRQLGHPRKETQTAIVAWILTIITAIIWIALNRFGMYGFLETWIYNVGYMLSYIGTSMALYKFVATALFLGQRFHHLNAIAVKSLPSTSTSKNIAKISRKTILNLHDDLMIAAENLDSLYSWSLLLWLGNLSLHIISDIYFIIMWLVIKPWDSASWQLICCMCVWLLACLFQLLLLHVACDFASSQANCIGPILIEWQIRLMRENHECGEPLLQFLNRKLNFSAAGFFNVNLQLLRSIAGLLTTYLVILLQLPR